MPEEKFDREATFALFCAASPGALLIGNPNPHPELEVATLVISVSTLVFDQEHSARLRLPIFPF